MKKALILILTIVLLLTACAAPKGMIGEEKAIDIAFEEALEWADGAITKDMAVCELLPDYGKLHSNPCYEITFDGNTEETLGFCVIVIVVIDAVTGEILEVMEAA